LKWLEHNTGITPRMSQYYAKLWEGRAKIRAAFRESETISYSILEAVRIASDRPDQQPEKIVPAKPAEPAPKQHDEPAAITSSRMEPVEQAPISQQLAVIDVRVEEPAVDDPEDARIIASTGRALRDIYEAAMHFRGVAQPLADAIRNDPGYSDDTRRDVEDCADFLNKVRAALNRRR
jgi:hypothetical protein